MRIIKLSSILFLSALALLLTGCNAELEDCRIQNDRQLNLIEQLRSEQQAGKLKLDQCERQLSTADQRCAAETDAFKQTVAALEEDLSKKNALIASMRQQLSYGGARLPVELTTLLEDFAKGQEMIEFDADKGIVKFKSDLLFERGSDKVMPAAADAIKALSKILSNEQAKKFDIIIAGHTDDVPIGKPDTRAKHPTNWHLSAHRGISVLDVMKRSGIVQDRMSVRGFGEFRPVEENKPNRKGNPRNRRVEIYIVPKGV